MEHSSHSFPAPVWDPSYGRQSSMDFSNVSPSQGQQFFTNCSSMAFLQGNKSCQQICFSTGSYLHGSAGAARNPLQHELSIVSQPPSGSHLPCCAVLQGLEVDVCSPLGFCGPQRCSLPHHALHQGLQGNLCPGTWSTSCLYFSPDLSICRAVSHSPLLWLQLLLCNNFFPYKYITSE